jgi:hypothetical protein
MEDLRGGFLGPPQSKKGEKMGRRIRRNEDWCPECGHLLPKKGWNCHFCGWSLYEAQRDALMDQTIVGDERRDLFDSSYTNDMDRFMDKLQRDSLDLSS